MSEYQNNSIFWVETSKIQPNPFQPRREFEPKALEDLADSIRQYGVLQPLVVTRKEIFRPDNEGMDVVYELIAGERRLRASKLAGLAQVPVIIRKETDNKVKLELAIIENLQREDLNPIDRALAFEQLYKEFDLTHAEIGKRMGKSRVYVSNTLRLLSLPEEIKQGLMAGRISEGHTRPLLMLIDRPEEQTTLFKEIMVKKLSVRDAEKVARKIAQDKVRKKEFIVDPKIRKYEKQLAENLGTRVHIEAKENGGQITIDYFTINDLEQILTSMKKVERGESMMESYLDGSINKPQQEIEQSTSIVFEPEEKVETPQVNHESTHIPTPKTAEFENIPEPNSSSNEQPETSEEKDIKNSEPEENREIPQTFQREEPHPPQERGEDKNEESDKGLVNSAVLRDIETQKTVWETQPQSQFSPDVAQEQERTPQQTPHYQDNRRDSLPENSQYQRPQHNQIPYYQNQAPRKKGFLGRLFG